MTTLPLPRASFFGGGDLSCRSPNELVSSSCNTITQQHYHPKKKKGHEQKTKSKQKEKEARFQLGGI